MSSDVALGPVHSDARAPSKLPESGNVAIGPERTLVNLAEEPREDGPGPAIGTFVRGTLWLSFRKTSEVFANGNVKPGQGRASCRRHASGVTLRGGAARLDPARGVQPEWRLRANSRH